MKIPKPTDADKARFQALVPEDPRVEVKPMFGNLGAFVNGNMFMGLFGSDIGLKLPEAEAHKVMESGGGPFGPAERPMSGYVSIPSPLTSAKARAWVGKSLAHVSSLPEKKPKAAKRKAP
jgi:TfoX/Sxy family transcriptional regulator of competence genes